MNINSYRYKFDEIKELLSDKIVDIFFVVESKLDATFNDNLFIAEGYNTLIYVLNKKSGKMIIRHWWGLINAHNKPLVRSCLYELPRWCFPVFHFCDVLDFSQLVLKPTCFMKNCIPSLVDVVLTNQKNQYFNIQNVPTGISDCHNIISVMPITSHCSFLFIWTSTLMFSSVSDSKFVFLLTGKSVFM
jgi:hypothetical protein